MKHRLMLSALLLITASALVVLTASAAAVYEVNWWSVDGGGASSSTGDTYSLAGTIGQPDAGPAMTGDTYGLIGGFMAGISGGPPPGPVNISGNAGIGAATLSYVDGGLQTTTADGSGDYSISVPSGWTGTVIPAMAGYSFTPGSRGYSSLLTDQLNQDYAADALPPEIAGLAPDAGTQTCLLPTVEVDLMLTNLLRTNGSFDPSVVTLSFDGTDVTDAATSLQTENSPASRARIRYTPGSELTPGAHAAEFTFPTAGGPYTLQWAFLAADMTCAAAPAAAPDSENDPAMRSVSPH
jgi:hypothetical protein